VRGAETAVAARLVRERENDTAAESPMEEEDTAPWWWEGKAAVETAMPWTARSAIGGDRGECVGLVWLCAVREMMDWMG
jgi:hypothetical protein